MSTVFLERYVLPVLSTATIALALLNPMGFDATQRITGVLAVIFAAYFVGHTVHKNNKSGSTTPPPPGPEASAGGGKAPRPEDGAGHAVGRAEALNRALLLIGKEATGEDKDAVREQLTKLLAKFNPGEVSKAVAEDKSRSSASKELIKRALAELEHETIESDKQKAIDLQKLKDARERALAYEGRVRTRFDRMVRDLRRLIQDAHDAEIVKVLDLPEISAPKRLVLISEERDKEEDRMNRAEVKFHGGSIWKLAICSGYVTLDRETPNSPYIDMCYVTPGGRIEPLGRWLLDTTSESVLWENDTVFGKVWGNTQKLILIDGAFRRGHVTNRESKWIVSRFMT